MLYTIPDYYKEFQCIADRCPDTCCAGWQIVIDQKTLKKYKKIKGDFRKRMLKSVNWMQGTFKQDGEKRCAFLNDKNLCDLYLSQGEEGFCKTCREYPRHTEEFEGVREITLSISCPEVARILMYREKPVGFLTYERPGEEEYEDFDPFLFSVLEDARKEMIEILQNRSLPLEDRILLVLGMGHDMQKRMNHQELFSCSGVITKYTTEKALQHVEEYRKKSEEKTRDRKFAHTMFRHLFQLEFLREDWEIVLKETEDFLYKNDVGYEDLRREFIKYFNPGLEKTAKENKPEEPKNHSTIREEISVEILLEQLLVYFLFTYFPGAVYDGEIYAKVQLAVFAVWMIWELWMARWMKNESFLDLEEMTEMVSRFSREIEHSDLNLKTIENIMSKKWFLR